MKHESLFWGIYDLRIILYLSHFPTKRYSRLGGTRGRHSSFVIVVAFLKNHGSMQVCCCLHTTTFISLFLFLSSVWWGGQSSSSSTFVYCEFFGILVGSWNFRQKGAKWLERENQSGERICHMLDSVPNWELNYGSSICNPCCTFPGWNITPAQYRGSILNDVSSIPVHVFWMDIPRIEDNWAMKKRCPRYCNKFPGKRLFDDSKVTQFQSRLPVQNTK